MRSFLFIEVFLVGCAASDDRVDCPPRTDPISRSEAFKVPSCWGSDSPLPSAYLETLTVDPAWVLTGQEKNDLARLVAAAHETSVREFKQSYYLRTDTRFWKLVVRTFPEAKDLATEGGALVYLGRLAEFLHSAAAGEAASASAGSVVEPTRRPPE
jgi:hypothetical protein